MAEISDAAIEAARKAAEIATAYQAKLLEIAQRNIKFTFEYSQALTTARLPSDFVKINNEYGKRRLEMFQQHTAELSALLTPANIPQGD